MTGERYRSSAASMNASTPWSVGSAGSRSPSTVSSTVLADDGGEWPAADEGEPAPALAVLDRLQQEAGFVGHHPAERGDRGDQVGDQLARDRHDGVGGSERVELVAARFDHAGPNARWKQLYSPSTWQAPLPSCSTTNSRVSPSQS